jgi:lipopolysaccharide/colanic/teichoic acid biosynthesis glycosyltransferase
MMRRAVDVVVSLSLLIVFSPVLAIIAAAVRLSSPGPVFYGAERVGQGGKLFKMLKFRTMVVGADKMGPGITVQDDPRVTRIGHFLRATKFDELPQFLNVLTSEMTLIGPRAESPQFVAHYTPRQRRLLDVPPGVTGPGQLRYTTEQQEQVGDLASAEDVYVKELLAAKLDRDLEYLERRGFVEDVKILAETAWVMVAGLGRAVGRLGRRAAAGPPAAASGPESGREG